MAGFYLADCRVHCQSIVVILPEIQGQAAVAKCCAADKDDVAYVIQAIILMELLRLFPAELMKSYIAVSVQSRSLLDTHRLQYADGLTDHSGHNR